MGGCSISLRSLMVALVFMISVISFAEGQSSSTPSCAQNLIPCAEYLNNTHPPSSCCDPLKKTVETQLTCLCNLFYSPGLLQSFNINVSQALDLSRHCGVTAGLSNCNRTGSAPSPSSTSITPPATRGGDNGAGRVAFTGLSFLLLFWASMLFN